jgi:ComF family protein
LPIVLNALIDLLLPPVCLACDGLIAIGDEKRLVCRRCRSMLRRPPEPCCTRCGAPRLRTGATQAASCSFCAEWPPAIRFARSACLLHPPADRIVHRLKYDGWRALAGPMAERMAGLDVPAELSEARLVVPVPTTRQRRRSRGYNQAELLARAYARCTGRACIGLLQRTTGNDSQTALQPLARAANVAGAFRVAADHDSLAGEHVLIVDDVLTTGATSSECARTLAAGGARCVSIVTFARALDARRLLGS